MFYQKLQFFFDFGIPIHLGVLFMYSRYASPYLSRRMRSSSGTPKCHEIIHTTPHNRKTQEAQAIPMPMYIKNTPKYIGFHEML